MSTEKRGGFGPRTHHRSHGQRCVTGTTDVEGPAVGAGMREIVRSALEFEERVVVGHLHRSVVIGGRTTRTSPTRTVTDPPKSPGATMRSAPAAAAVRGAIEADEQFATSTSSAIAPIARETSEPLAVTNDGRGRWGRPGERRELICIRRSLVRRLNPSFGANEGSIDLERC